MALSRPPYSAFLFLSHSLTCACVGRSISGPIPIQTTHTSRCVGFRAGEQAKDDPLRVPNAEPRSTRLNQLRNVESMRWPEFDPRRSNSEKFPSEIDQDSGWIEFEFEVRPRGHISQACSRSQRERRIRPVGLKVQIMITPVRVLQRALGIKSLLMAQSGLQDI